MGFLEKLQDIGIGNRGPQGNRQSGASSYVDYMKQLHGEAGQRALSQAMANAAKEGGSVDPKTTAELSDRFGIPFLEAQDRVNRFNEANKIERIKKILPKAMESIQIFTKENEGKTPTEIQLDEIMRKVGVTPDIAMGARVAVERYLGTVQKEKKYMQLDPTKELVSISGQEVKTERPGKPSEPSEPSLIRQYNLAREQFKTGQGKDPGSFTKWKKDIAKSGATRITIDQKVQEQEAKSNLAIRQAVKKVDFQDNVAKSLKSQHARTWDFKEEWERQELIFREMDRQIRVAYQEQEVAFDEERNPPGWYIGNKLIRRWTDPNKPHRTDGLR